MQWAMSIQVEKLSHIIQILPMFFEYQKFNQQEPQHYAIGHRNLLLLFCLPIAKNNPQIVVQSSKR